ncbi:MAG: sugar phosphate isomerase/epimerase family protein [Chitinophagaceae bacterium]
MNRRKLLKLLGASTGISLLPGLGQARLTPAPQPAFIYCLNMATIRGHKLGFIKELEIASQAGFPAVEIWIDSLQTWLNNGGNLKDAKKRLDGLGLRVESAIGFAEWIVDDQAKRTAGLEKMKQEMEMLAEIGCKRTAAPPAGATQTSGLDMQKAAERYRAILELGDQTGVVPHLELWGFSKNLSRLSEVTYVAIESGHKSARVLLDVYHLYKGGSSLNTLSLINKTAVDILHMNDYPANMPPSSITDAERIYPGDGVAPVRLILQTLKSPARPLILSLEVFNKTYYSQDPLLVAKTALAKMKTITKGI